MGSIYDNNMRALFFLQITMSLKYALSSRQTFPNQSGIVAITASAHARTEQTLPPTTANVHVGAPKERIWSRALLLILLWLVMNKAEI